MEEFNLYKKYPETITTDNSMENNLTREETKSLTAEEILEKHIVGPGFHKCNYNVFDEDRLPKILAAMEEAIHLSKIGALKEAIVNSENIKERYLPSSTTYFVLTLVIEKLNSQIKDLTHGK